MYQAISSHQLVVFIIQIVVLLGVALALGELATLAGMPALTEICAPGLPSGCRFSVTSLEDCTVGCCPVPASALPGSAAA
jgi:hypothetical protein